MIAALTALALATATATQPVQAAAIEAWIADHASEIGYCGARASAQDKQHAPLLDLAVTSDGATRVSRVMAPPPKPRTPVYSFSPGLTDCLSGAIRSARVVSGPGTQVAIRLSWSGDKLLPGPAVPPVIEGAMDRVAVDAKIVDHMPAVRECYRVRLAARPTMRGRIIARLSVDGAGNVQTQELVENTVDDGVGTCVLEVLRTITFPRPTSGTAVITYPFQFQPT